MFLGAFTATLAQTGDPKEAAIFGSVAASFAMEQYGIPKLTKKFFGIPEQCNGTVVAARIKKSRAHLPEYEDGVTIVEE